jgi:hypothetical protein
LSRSRGFVPAVARYVTGVDLAIGHRVSTTIKSSHSGRCRRHQIAFRFLEKIDGGIRPFACRGGTLERRREALMQLVAGVGGVLFSESFSSEARSFS